MKYFLTIFYQLTIVKNCYKLYIAMNIIKFLYISLIIILISSYTYAFESKKNVNLIKIIDGDTIEVSINNNKFFVRLINIDCFETSKINRAYKQAYENNMSVDEIIKTGQQSKEYLETLYKKTNKVYLDFMGIDKYSRVLGYIYFDKLNVNEEMKINGSCLQYKYEK